MKTKKCYSCRRNLTLGCFKGQRAICNSCALRNQQKKQQLSKPSFVSEMLAKWKRACVTDTD